jgi:hypothetical protein
MSDRLMMPKTAPASEIPFSSGEKGGDSSSLAPTGRQTIFLPFLLACGAFLLLYVRSFIGPVIFYDDFDILPQSWTWQRTCANLWVPQNEHAMPLGRVFCFGLEWLAGRPSKLPLLTTRVGPLALLLALVLIYVFVRREMGHPFYALLVVVLFAVTTVYHQAVWWFAASFVILALDTTLLGLLAAQRWRQTGRARCLVFCVLACALAPTWFALGILAGPLCCLYLMPISFSRNPEGSAWRASLRVAAKQVCLALVPMAGSALFLAVSLPRTREAIMHTGHYGDKTALEAFHPLVGLAYTARSLVDNLFLGLVGVCGILVPLWRVALVLLVAAALGVYWWWQARERRLMLLGLGLIFCTYLLCYSARAEWGYERMVEPAFARYHLLPHLGLVLFFCGGLSGRADRWFALDGGGAIGVRQRWLLYGVIGTCFLIQLPRGLLCGAATGWDQIGDFRKQQADLRRIEEVEARCRRYHVSADAARQALGKLEVHLSLGVGDGWDFLTGSDDPQPRSPEEIKRLLSE